jgi:hypothetical protein
MAESYTGIRIDVGRRGAGGAYPVRAELDDGSVFDGGELRVNMTDLLVAVLDPKEYGLDLFDALFHGPIRRAYDKVTGRAEAETGGGVRVRLLIDDSAAELHAVPWERIYHIHHGDEVALAASVLTPFSRNTWLERGEAEAVTERPLRLLFALANPTNLPLYLPALEVEREVAYVHEALGDLSQVGQVEITLLPGRTGLPEPLVDRLQASGYKIEAGPTTLAKIQEHLPGCHIFHLLCHGHFDRQGDQGEGVTHLYLETSEGTWTAVGDEEIVDGLARLGQPPHLVFLAACESAKRVTEAENAFVGLGPKLVKAGVPAVVAMQDIVPVETARRLTAYFYRGLLRHGVVDQAMNEARYHLFDAERIDWATPVLFMRLRTGELVAPDPARTTLQAILQRYERERPALTVKVIHVVGPPNSHQLDQIGLSSVPAVELADAVDTVLSRSLQEEPGRSRQGKLILLVGAHGMAKTTQLQHIASQTAKRSLITEDTAPVIPLYVDLGNYKMGRSGSLGLIEAQVLELLKGFWPDLQARSLGELPLREKGLRLRLLFDGTDDLAHTLRADAWEEIQNLAMRYPQDELLLAIDAENYTPDLLQGATDLLVDVRLSVLQTILARYEDGYPVPAVEVVHLPGQPDPIDLEQIGMRGVPAADLVEAVGRLLAEPVQEEPGKPRTGKLILLVSAPGMAKTAQLHHIISRTAKRSLIAHDSEPIIPVYVDLSYSRMEWSGSPSPVEAQVLEVLREFWLDLHARSLADLPLREKGLRLRLFLDGTDDLTDTYRLHAWQEIQYLARRFPQDEYLLAINADRYVPRLLPEVTDLLVVVPLSSQAIERFLKEPRNEPYGSRLYDALSRRQLLDLASFPRLLVGMLEQARQGRYPTSRAVVLENLVEDAIAEIPTEHGMRSRTRPTLYALAWAMQSAHRTSLEARDAFEIMDAVRANREYSLEELVDALVHTDLMVRVGEDSIRFRYPLYQSYCAARQIASMPERDQVLDDIAVSLGRLTRLRWWEGTLVLLSGLMSDPRVLHRKMLYGASVNEGEEIFLIVRCLLESSEMRIAEDVRNQVVDALISQLDSANERCSTRRVRAAHALAQLRERTAIPDLVNVATKEVRINSQGGLMLDLTDVRMAAATALRRMMLVGKAQIESADARLGQLLDLWCQQDVTALEEQLLSGDVVASGIAAAALADLQTDDAFRALAGAVRRKGLPADTGWALTDALSLQDPVRVTQEVIVPLIESGTLHWYERLAYLIGKTRIQDATALAFLDRCLHEFKRVDIKAQAIQSVGWLQDRTKTRLLEYVAMGRFADIEKATRQQVRQDDDAADLALKKGFSLGKVTVEDGWLLRRKAIEALAQIGDADTLSLLREGRAEWDAELRRAFYRSSEEIHWREQVRAHW